MSFWRYSNKNIANPEIEEKFKIGTLINKLMANRGITSLEDALIYLDPNVSRCTDFSTAKDVTKSLDIVLSAINNKEKITIYGDYDVDGVVSTSILYKSFSRLGANIAYYLPDRHTEGYGLNINAVENLAKSGTKLLLTCDNGIAATDEIKRAKELGMKVVVIDHHEPKFIVKDGIKEYILPEADALIDAKQADCPYKFKNLCAAGMCYYYAEKVYEKAGCNYNDIKAEMLALAAVATVCDMVELKGDNRIIVRNGLKILNNRLYLNKGLEALFNKRDPQKKSYKITESTLGFFTGPCINAAGRLKKGDTAVEMLISDDPDTASEYADALISLNEERKQLTAETYEKSVEYIKEHNYDKDNVIIAALEEISQSVAGIAAGNLKERFNKPVIAISLKNEPATGSARSIEGYNIFEALLSVSELFVKFGGHAQAAGITIKKKNIELLRKALNDSYYNPDYPQDGITDIDFETDFDALTIKNVEELHIMHPLGMGNEAPVFSTSNVVVKSIHLVGEEKKVIQLVVYDSKGTRMRAISFSGLDKFKPLFKEVLSQNDYEKIFMKYISTAVDIPADIAYSAEINVFNNAKSVQLHIKDIKLRKH